MNTAARPPVSTPSSVREPAAPTSGTPARLPRWLAHHPDATRHLLGLAGPVLAGAVSVAVMPRGPATTGQALLAMALGAAAGLAAGWLSRSRWAMVTAPVAALAVVELGKLGLDGLTVSAPNLTSTWGVMAFLAGRGVQGLLMGAPMLVLAAVGAGLARRTQGRPRATSRASRVGLAARRAGTGFALVALLGLAVAVARPASTATIRGTDGARLAGSVAELVSLEVGGHDQWLSLRGRTTDAPVLLYLEGGPGGSAVGSSRVVFSELEADFVVAVYEQRGTGKSYGSLEPTRSLTLDQAVADTTEVVQYLRQRFDEEKIYLLGESWGSTLGVLTVQRHPELFHAYIGSGQMVSQLDTDRRLYADVLALAARTGDDDLATTMHSFGPPPYADALGYATVMGYYEALEPYEEPAGYRELGARPGNDVGFMGIKAPEYTLIDRVNVVRGLIDTFGVMYPQLQGIDFRRDVRRLDVPVYVLLGGHELDARAALVTQWLDVLSAPRVVLERYSESAHAPHAQEYARFHSFMVNTVVPQTYSAG